MSEKEIYLKNCCNESTSIFSQHWWLDAVVGDNGWDVILIKKDKIVIGALPYTIQKFGYFFKGIYNPHLTPRTNLFLDYSNIRTNEEKSSFEIYVLKKIICKIPKVSFFSINLNRSNINLMPFHWDKFNATVRYTYIIDDLQNAETIFNNFHKRTRRHIKRAKIRFSTSESNDINLFYKLNTDSFRRKNIKIPYSFSLLNSIDKACKVRNKRKIIIAHENNNIVAGIYLVWDKKSMYYLASGVLESYKSTGVASLLVWEAIKFASKMNKIFDFEGSMNYSIEPFFRSFNPKLKTYINISKYSNIFLKLYKNLH